MKTTKISLLSGSALDWAVAKCQKANIHIDADGCIWEQDTPQCEPLAYSPSTDWARGGQIIEDEKIELTFSQFWRANITAYATCSGVTPLRAAMRCYVASKPDSDNISIPDNL